MRSHNRRASRGSVIVEAAIFIPVFIIALLTIAFTMKTFYLQEYYQHHLSEEISLIAAEAGIINQSHRMYQIDEKICIERLRYLFNGQDENHHDYPVSSSDLIEVTASYSVHNPFVIRMISDYSFIQRIVVRAWTGREKEIHPINFEAMEENNPVQTVYIFPKSGKKYHQPACGLISNTPVQSILTDTVENQNQPCKLCHAEKIPLGGYIYVFNDKIFHSRECSLVTRRIEPIPLEEAVERGYEPCKICH